MIGGFSPGFMFGPLVGTSAGRLGRVGGPLLDEVRDDVTGDVAGGDRDGWAEDTGETGAELGGEESGALPDEVGEPPLEEVHAAASSTLHTATAQPHRTSA